MTDHARITLSFSAHHGVTAITSGKNYRWADTALQAAGFTLRLGDGPRALPRSSPAEVPAALRELAHHAQRYRATVTVSDRPYLGDVAEQIARALPGTWTTQIEVYCRQVWQQDLLDWLWDTNGDLSQALTDDRIPYAAVLTCGTDELLVIDRPSHSEYLVGAFLPTDVDRLRTENRHLSHAPGAPNSIRVPDLPNAAAHAIATQLLPSYRQAAHQLRIDRVTSALAKGQHALDSWDAVSDSLADEQGFPLDDEVYGQRIQQRDAEVWDQFRMFLDHGQHLLDATEAHLAEHPPPHPAQAELTLQMTRAVLERGLDGLTEWGQDPAKIVQFASPHLYAEAVAERNAEAWDAMVTWLEQGPALMALARRALGPTSARPADAPAVPSRLPAVARTTADPGAAPRPGLPRGR